MPWTCFTCRCVLVIFHLVQHENFMLVWTCARLIEYHIRQLLWKQGRWIISKGINHNQWITSHGDVWLPHVLRCQVVVWWERALVGNSRLRFCGRSRPSQSWCSSWCHACSRCTLISYCFFFLIYYYFFCDTTKKKKNIYIYI